MALYLAYNPPWTSVTAGTDGQQMHDYPVAGTIPSGPTINFGQARICAEPGTTPWAAPKMRTPAATTTLMSLDRSAPPNAVEIADLAGQTGGLTSHW